MKGGQWRVLARRADGVSSPLGISGNFRELWKVIPRSVTLPIAIAVVALWEGGVEDERL